MCFKENDTDTEGDDKPNDKDMEIIWETKVFLD
jgi:hypothetical protein